MSSGMLEKIKAMLGRLSFRTGIIILAVCIACYIASFAQMLLPISATAKSILWFILFGLAKTTQYTALAIIGVKGWSTLKTKIKNNKQNN